MEKKRLRQKKAINEDLRLVRNMFILLIIVALCILGIYFLTNKLLNKDQVKSDNTSKVNIDYTIATIGTMFNRSEDEYYVFLYSSDNDGKIYDTILSSYRSSANYIKTYYIDLDIKFNSSALGNELVKKPTNSSEVKVKGATLYKIKNGKVINCYSSKDKIIDILK